MLLFENEGYDAIDLLLVNRAANRTDENDYVSDESLKKKNVGFFFFFCNAELFRSTVRYA